MRVIRVWCLCFVYGLGWGEPEPKLEHFIFQDAGELYFALWHPKVHSVCCKYTHATPHTALQNYLAASGFDLC